MRKELVAAVRICCRTFTRVFYGYFSIEKRYRWSCEFTHRKAAASGTRTRARPPSSPSGRSGCEQSQAAGVRRAAAGTRSWGSGRTGRRPSRSRRAGGHSRLEALALRAYDGTGQSMMQVVRRHVRSQSGKGSLPPHDFLLPPRQLWKCSKFFIAYRWIILYSRWNAVFTLICTSIAFVSLKWLLNFQYAN